MKNKKLFLIVLCVIVLAALAGVLCVGMHAVPTVNHALRISELLQPVLEAKNQRMRIAVSAKIDGKPIGAESDIFLVTEDGVDYFALEQNGNTVFVSGNLLLLENGKAFKIGEEIQLQLTSCQDLLAHIGLLYDALKITAEKDDNETVYSIMVTGDRMDALLAAAALSDVLPVEGIEQLNLQLTEKNGKLEQIRFSGNRALAGTAVILDVTLSDFRILAAGDYPIPEEVKQSAATVDPNTLFSLTEDMYRLVVALAPVADMESVDGTLALAVDCGPIQLQTKLRISELETACGSLEPEKLRALPEVLGLMCMEGDLSCTKEGSVYMYCLVLDQPAIQELARMILPELAQYGGNLTEGSVTILLENGRIRSMHVSIGGKITALITQIPIAVGVEFSFD